MSPVDSSTSCDNCGENVPSNEAVWSRDEQSVHCSDACLAQYDRKHPDPAYEPEEMPIPPPSALRRCISVIAQRVSSFFP